MEKDDAFASEAKLPSFLTATARYPRPGSCIYCFNAGTGDEHIIPESLGGRMIIEKASCRGCEAKTSAFEGFFAGYALKAFRSKHGLRSKRPKGHLASAPAAIFEMEGQPATIRELPIEDHPATFVIPTLPGPLILGAHPICSPRPGGMWSYPADAPPMVLGPMNWGHMMRLIAKIGHAYAVAERGRRGLRTFLPSIVRGVRRGSSQQFVGGDVEINCESDAPHGLELLEIDHTYGRLLLCRVQLFRQLTGALAEGRDGESRLEIVDRTAPAPIFVAVVGQLL